MLPVRAAAGPAVVVVHPVEQAAVLPAAAVPPVAEAAARPLPSCHHFLVRKRKPAKARSKKKKSPQTKKAKRKRKAQNRSRSVCVRPDPRSAVCHAHEAIRQSARYAQQGFVGQPKASS